MQQKTELYQRFINILELKTRSPSLEALSELLASHLSTIPFENISKLYYKATLNQDHLPSFDQYLEGIEKYNFGGTCYSNNYYLFKLLGFLGYQVQLNSADMKNPGVHMVVRVRLEEGDYLLDVGYAAPFIQAVPLYLEKDFTIESGNDQYVFKPMDETGRTKLFLFRKGSYKHGYTVRAETRSIEDFKLVISNSFRPDSTFFKSLLVTKFIAGNFCTLHNLEYTETTDTGLTYHRIPDLDSLASMVENKFKIPASISSNILAELDMSGDAWN